jgi:hypothetical protein
MVKDLGLPLGLQQQQQQKRQPGLHQVRNFFCIAKETAQ